MGFEFISTYSRGIHLLLEFFRTNNSNENTLHNKKQAIIGPPAKHHLSNGFSMRCQYWPNIECWPCLTHSPGSFVIFQGVQTRIPKETHNFVIFQGDPDPSPPMDPCIFNQGATTPAKFTQP